MNDINQRIAALTPEKRSLLARRLLENKNRAATPVIPRRAAGRSHIPLSFAQERLWFLSQLTPHTPLYNNPLPARARVSFSFDIRVLERSLNEIVRRHEAIRTSFQLLDGAPVQVINPDQHLNIEALDLRHVSAPRREAEASRIMVEEGRRPFDLARGPLLRLKTLRMTDEEYILLLTPHHIVSDGWSNGIFLREIAALYESFEAGRRSSLPELPIQYADFALWQRDWLQGERLQRLSDYWRRQLAGPLPVLTLPQDYARPASDDSAGAVESAAVGQELLDRLKAQSARAETTLFTTLLAAFYVLLFRHTGEKDLIVGTPTANRTRPETEGLLGVFVNTLALRTDVSGNPTFGELVRRVRDVSQQAFAHQEMPFEKVVEQMQPERTLLHAPIFQVMFVFQNAPLALELPGMSLRPLRVDYGVSKFDLTLHAEQTDRGLLLTANYRTGLFERETVRRLLQHYCRILEEVVEHPGRPIAALQLLSQAERRTLLVDYNRTERVRPRACCFQELFKEQVRRSPNTVAVESGDSRLTYRELNRRADDLARRLRSAGVGVDEPVLLLAGRTVNMVVGVLGIFKAGAAYVPLEPSSPEERLAFVLEDTGARVLVTESRVRHLVGKVPCRVITLDTDAPPARYESPDVSVSAENLAYVIYTSGTTGRPKGVAVEHRQLVHYVHAAQHMTGLTGRTNFAMLTTLAADLGNTMLFLPLASGGTVHVLTQEQASDAQALARYFEAHPVECLKTVPSHLSALLTSPKAAAILPKKLVILAGETLRADLVHKVSSLAPGCRIQNFYGPTETTVTALGFSAEARRARGRPEAVPIGRPFAGVRAYVLDADLRPVPQGVVGELFIAGPGVARGYVNQPALTAMRFLPDPFVDVAGARMYRTGDLVRYAADSNLEFRGRVDDQVKIRGYRVELREVERVLCEHPGVDSAAVVARDNSAGEKLLIAYVVPRTDRRVSVAVIKDFLRRKLPAYMVPRALMLLETLPLTPNGKVDRDALPAPLGAGEQKRPNVTPRDGTELKLARIWSDVLGLPTVGATDNFFELGGHSLLAVRLMARIDEVFGQPLPLATLFEDGTVEQQARRLRGQHSDAPQSPLVALQPKGLRLPLFFIHPAGGNVMCYYHLSRLLGDEQPFYALQVPEFGADPEPHTRIEDMAASYISAVREVQKHGPYLLGGWSMGALVAFEIARQLEAGGQRVAMLAVLDQPAPAPESGMPPSEHDRDALLLAAFARKVELFSGRKLAISYPALREMTTEAQAACFLEEFKSAGLVPPDIELRHFKHYLDVQRRHNLAAQNYCPDKFGGRITLFRSSDPLVIEADSELSYPAEGQRSATLGWERFTRDVVEVERVPGNHITMVTPPYVQTLAERLRIRVDEALPRPSPAPARSPAAD